nr:amidase [Phycisphaerae bacterium]NIX31078.1 amidase [Phycisphaerae bacterium]
MVRKYGLIFAFILFGLVCFLFGAFLQEKEEPNPLTAEMVRQAEKLLGLKFTPVERDSMLDGLKEQQLDSYEEIREVDLNNSVPPAFQFNPIPVGAEFDSVQQPFKISTYEAPQVPQELETLAFVSVGQLSELIKSGKVTSEQLTRMYLSRLKKHGPKLKCVITLTEELALKQARRADREIAAGKYRGPLHGIPYGAKDLLAVKGYPTTWGAAPYKDQLIDENATVIKRLEEAGAVLVAKLTMGALAWGDVWYGGKTRNPWNLEQGSSGSSAGSASAAAAGLVGFAIGTETWGSIVSPSTRCGVTGLRPTYGRVSRTGAMA